jgi:hypothetical protein
MAAKISNPAARSRNGELLFFRLRSDKSGAPFDPSDEDIVAAELQRSGRGLQDSMLIGFGHG